MSHSELFIFIQKKEGKMKQTETVDVSKQNKVIQISRMKQ